MGYFGVWCHGHQLAGFDNSLGNEIACDEGGVKINARAEIVGVQALCFAILVNSRIDIALTLVYPLTPGVRKRVQVRWMISYFVEPVSLETRDRALRSNGPAAFCAVKADSV
jgi:hypothetical protein